MLRLVLAALAALSLGGCVTTPNTLTSDQLATFKLSAVEVGFEPQARVWWGDGERAFAAAKGVPAERSEALAATDEGRAYLRGAVAKKLRAAIEAELAPMLGGERPVRVVVDVKDVMIASDIQRIVVGGHHSLSADVNLVDGRTGALLQAFPAQTVTSFAGQGIGGALLDRAFMGDPIDRVTGQFASRYAAWLLRR